MTLYIYAYFVEFYVFVLDETHVVGSTIGMLTYLDLKHMGTTQSRTNKGP